jgi:gliding motility-associated-like protein
MITVFPRIEAEFVYSPTTVSSLDPDVFFYDQSTNAAYWNWSFGDTMSGIYNHSFDQSPNHSFYGPGTYTIWLIATNSSGCVDSVSHVLEVKEPLSFFVPNAFTPNNDGLNDVFMPVGLGIDPNNFIMYIFDRWGEAIYNSNDLYKGWNGRTEGSDKLCQMGVYVWLIDYKDINGDRHKINGRVTLVR